MRFHKLLAVLGLIAVIAFVGCGSDSSAPTQTTGSILDPEFVAVQGEIDFFVDSTLDFVVNGLANLTVLVGEDELIDPVHYGSIDPESDYVSSSYVDGWHVVTITRDRDNYGVYLQDSIQFNGPTGLVQQIPVSCAGLTYNHFWTYVVYDTSVSHSNYEGRCDMTFVGLDGSMATINGTHDLTIQSKYVDGDAITYRTFGFDADINDLGVAKTPVGWAQGCPSTGTVTGVIEMAYDDGDGTPVTTDWSYTLRFTDGTMSATVRRGTVVWTYSTDVCVTP